MIISNLIPISKTVSVKQLFYYKAVKKRSLFEFVSLAKLPIIKTGLLYSWHIIHKQTLLFSTFHPILFGLACGGIITGLIFGSYEWLITQPHPSTSPDTQILNQLSEFYENVNNIKSEISKLNFELNSISKKLEINEIDFNYRISLAKDQLHDVNKKLLTEADRINQVSTASEELLIIIRKDNI
jgi:hypothetical protein